jgi:hypothetical protein
MGGIKLLFELYHSWSMDYKACESTLERIKSSACGESKSSSVCPWLSTTGGLCGVLSTHDAHVESKWQPQVPVEDTKYRDTKDTTNEHDVNTTR